MKPQIFDIENGQLIINEQILAIPELKAVYEEYDNPKPALMYLRHLCDPYSAYNQIEEDIKDEVVFNDFPGEYSPEDPVMIAARKKLESFYMTPSYRYFLDNKTLLETLGKYARTVQARDDGKNSNIPHLQSQINNLAKSMASFKQFEKMAEEELQKSRIRGGAFESYDAED